MLRTKCLSPACKVCKGGKLAGHRVQRIILTALVHSTVLHPHVAYHLYWCRASSIKHTIHLEGVTLDGECRFPSHTPQDGIIGSSPCCCSGTSARALETQLPHLCLCHSHHMIASYNALPYIVLPFHHTPEAAAGSQPYCCNCYQMLGRMPSPDHDNVRMSNTSLSRSLCASILPWPISLQ